jgi:C4-type Zn-finger protein
LFTGVPPAKEVVTMTTMCDYCGHKATEVRPEAKPEVEATGKRITLRVTNRKDLDRDIFKVGRTYLENLNLAPEEMH